MFRGYIVWSVCADLSLINGLVYLAFIDLLNFKRINSNFGHKKEPVDDLPIFGNRNRDCARKRLDCCLIASRTTFGQLIEVADGACTRIPYHVSVRDPYSSTLTITLTNRRVP